ncbi:FtsQ-type POTRA domain-containing protein [Microbacterium kyungheense]|uniref:Cell division protein FtsQ n=1 Tax=Microbacterium kyungheense TaxID=1263636 RepID=A0A543FM50_9MICO|nr:FtsQ-type POTRA domain-containing protein [Microbacterium kyungheense]TQM34930.1 cell division protein FtsQ [Microbacterium kyungheense]
MRRPSPLPQSPVAPRGGAATGARAASGPADAVADRDAGTVIPLAPGARDEEGTRDDGVPATSGPDTADGVADEVGFREVLKAARARRKALRAEVRRFTVRQRRRRALWLGAAASLFLLALGTIGAAYSPLFGVEKISVVGAQQLNEADVAAALSGQLGTPLPLVDESAVKKALVAFPLVETYALEARPPHELVIRIVERTPVGLIETRAGYTLVDAAGVALSTTATPTAGVPVLTITGGVDSDAFAAAGQVMRSLPDDIRSQVTAVSASTPDDVTLTLGGTNTQVVWGSAEQSALKAMVLQKTMAGKPPADVYTYDVSSPEAVVVR